MSEFKRLMRETMWAPMLLSVAIVVAMACGIAISPLATIYTLLLACVVALVFCLVKMVSYL